MTVIITFRYTSVSSTDVQGYWTWTGLGTGTSSFTSSYSSSSHAHHQVSSRVQFGHSFPKTHAIANAIATSQPFYQDTDRDYDQQEVDKSPYKSHCADSEEAEKESGNRLQSAQDTAEDLPTDLPLEQMNGDTKLTTKLPTDLREFAPVASPLRKTRQLGSSDRLAVEDTDVHQHAQSSPGSHRGSPVLASSHSASHLQRRVGSFHMGSPLGSPTELPMVSTPPPMPPSHQLDEPEVGLLSAVKASSKKRKKADCNDAVRKVGIDYHTVFQPSHGYAIPAKHWADFKTAICDAMSNGSRDNKEEMSFTCNVCKSLWSQYVSKNLVDVSDAEECKEGTECHQKANTIFDLRLKWLQEVEGVVKGHRGRKRKTPGAEAEAHITQNVGMWLEARRPGAYRAVRPGIIHCWRCQVRVEVARQSSIHWILQHECSNTHWDLTHRQHAPASLSLPLCQGIKLTDCSGPTLAHKEIEHFLLWLQYDCPWHMPGLPHKCSLEDCFTLCYSALLVARP